MTPTAGNAELVRRFRKKPVVIEACKFDGSFESVRSIVETNPDIVWSSRGNGSYVAIKTLEGIMEASPGDWIIKGIKGEFYPCKPDIFEATYEPAALEATASPVTDSYWHSIDTAPEDLHVILATTGGHVGEALMLRDEDTGEQKWTWAGGPVSRFHIPLGWRHMPEALNHPIPRDDRPSGFDGPTGAE